MITLDADECRSTSSTAAAAKATKQKMSSGAGIVVGSSSESESEKDEIQIRAELDSDNSNDGDYQVIVSLKFCFKMWKEVSALLLNKPIIFYPHDVFCNSIEPSFHVERRQS